MNSGHVQAVRSRAVVKDAGRARYVSKTGAPLQPHSLFRRDDHERNAPYT